MTVRVFTIGESMGLIRTESVGDFSDAANAVLDSAGSEGNVAIGLARYGLPVTWLGRVGDDAWGRRVIGDLRSQGVDVQAVIDRSAPTGVMFKASPRQGRTTVTYYRAGSAGSRLRPSDLDEVDVASFDLVHLTGITAALSPTAAAAASMLADRAQAAGVPISFDVNYRSRLWTADDARDPLRALAQRANFLIAGQDEAELLVGPGLDADELLSRLHDLGPEEVVVKRGADGALVSSAGRTVDVPAEPANVIDTVGAGDAFTAVYLAEMLKGAPVRQRTERAVVAGALACEHPGDWRGAPFRSEVMSRGGGWIDPVAR